MLSLTYKQDTACQIWKILQKKEQEMREYHHNLNVNIRNKDEYICLRKPRNATRSIIAEIITRAKPLQSAR